jgi:hypothetical protein
MLKARFLMTETWRRESGIETAHGAPTRCSDPPAVTLAASELQNRHYSGGADLNT